MSSNLLREYISLMVEKIRTKKGQKGSMGDKFDLKKFKELPNHEVMVAYASKFLEKMGQGSSRVAFVLSSKHVLKIAINAKGLGQNQAEVEVYTNPKSKPIVAKIYQAGDDNTWVISDLVKPIKDEGEFEQLAGVDWRTFSEYVNTGVKDKQVPKGAPPFVQSVIQTALTNQMLRGDLVQQDFSHSAAQDVLDHWGKTPDGRIALLDYGLSEDVWTSHYKGKQAAEPAPSAPSDAKTNKGGSQSNGVDALGKTKADSGTREKPVSGYEKTMKAKSKPDGDREAQTAAPKRYVPPEEEPKTVAPGKRMADKTRR